MEETKKDNDDDDDDDATTEVYAKARVKVIVLYPKGKTSRNFPIRLNATFGTTFVRILAKGYKSIQYLS